MGTNKEKEMLSIVVPCYNEQEVIQLFYAETIKQLRTIKNLDYEFVFVDDGSKDDTLLKLKELKNKDNKIRVISFSRNFGKEAAIYAGLSNSSGDLVVLMDADLQHDPRYIKDMYENILEGYDTVTTKRIDRKGESPIKNFFARMFYWMMKKLVDTEVVQGAQDYRMMKRIVVDAILSLKEYNRFSKGIFSWVGFKVKYIEVENRERAAGETKWSFKNLFKYAVEGIVGFSTVPLKVSIFLGTIISIIAVICAFIIILETCLYGRDVPGYASIITSILFMGGIQLLSFGIVAEYISKMYLEIKDRPKYIIRENIKD